MDHTINSRRRRRMRALRRILTTILVGAAALCRVCAQVEQAWVSRYNGPANHEDHPVALKVDDSGNIYVTGFSKGSNGFDYATVKYAADGTQLLAAGYNGPDNLDDLPAAL